MARVGRAFELREVEYQFTNVAAYQRGLVPQRLTVHVVLNVSVGPFHPPYRCGTPKANSFSCIKRLRRRMSG